MSQLPAGADAGSVQAPQSLKCSQIVLDWWVLSFHLGCMVFERSIISFHSFIIYLPCYLAFCLAYSRTSRNLVTQ